MTSTTVGMNTCSSIQSREKPGLRCPCKPIAGLEWCGRHRGTQVRFVSPEVITHEGSPDKRRGELLTDKKLGAMVYKAWGRWLGRRAGPLLRFREESNNPFDFYSSDPVAEIPMRDFVSFVDAGKGYVMDIKSAVSLLEHSTSSAEPPENPFNRAPLPALFLRRVALHQQKNKAAVKSWAALEPLTEAQKLSLSVTDVFRVIEDLGYYTDPSWFIGLGRIGLQRLYMELADIWFHRATLSTTGRAGICPSGSPFGVPVSTALIMQQKALRPLVLNTCRLLVSTASSRSDKQLGTLYVLGALAIVSEGCTAAYPWLLEPGVTRIVNGALVVLHPSVLAY